LAAVLTGGLVACSSGSSARDVAQDPTGSVDAGPLGLPGDEALTPPPPDPEASDQLAALAALPDGALAGHVQLAVSGLAAFDEPVDGTCTGMAVAPMLEARLSDGSLLRVSFDADRATSVLTAPGIEARHALDNVRTTVDGTAVSIEGDLLTDGTTERSGSLLVTGECT
jgi:microcompartment protein CcmK/EutM